MSLKCLHFSSLVAVNCAVGDSPCLLPVAFLPWGDTGLTGVVVCQDSFEGLLG